MRNRKANHGPVGKFNGSLHQSLAKRAAPDHETAVLVLYGTGYDFGSRSGIVVHQHDEFTVKELASASRTHLLMGHGTAVGVNDHIVLLQELTGNVHRRLHVTAAVLFQVEDEALHALTFQFHDGIAHLGAGSHAETAQAYKAHSGTNHVCGIDGVEGNLVAYDTEGKHLFHAAAHHFQVGYGALGAAQFLHDVGPVHLDAGQRGVVDRNDAVAGKNADLFGGPLRHGLVDHKCIVQYIELHTDAFKISVQRLTHFTGFFGRGVTAVRVERGQHAAYGFIGELAGVDGINVELLNGHLGTDQLVQSLLHGTRQSDLGHGRNHSHKKEEG